MLNKLLANIPEAEMLWQNYFQPHGKMNTLTRTGKNFLIQKDKKS